MRLARTRVRLVGPRKSQSSWMVPHSVSFDPEGARASAAPLKPSENVKRRVSVNESAHQDGPSVAGRRSWKIGAPDVSRGMSTRSLHRVGSGRDVVSKRTAAEA